MARVWRRDGSQLQSSHSSAATSPCPSGKRKLVWVRESVPKIESGSQVPVGDKDPSASCEPPVHNRSVAETSCQGQQPPEKVVKRQCARPQPFGQDPLASELRKKEEELARLKHQILEQQRKLQYEAAIQKQRVAADLADERRRNHERRQKLASAFAGAVTNSKLPIQASEKRPLDVADELEVQRVLNSKTDYDCLKLRAGSDAAAIRRRYRELAFALHPDKCKVAGAPDAFRKLVKSYHNLLKYVA